jgi:hypothetical protein
MHPALTKILVGALTAAVVAVTAATGVLAQTPAPTPTEKPRAERADRWLEALASRLGKTPEELRAAVVAAQKDVIARAVAEGRLTQEQADRLNRRVEQAGSLGGLSRPKIAAAAARARLKGGPKIAVGRELADYLGLPPRDLIQQLRSGRSLAEVAQARGKSRDDVKTFLTNQARTRLDRAVTNGNLTREQADARLKRLTDQLDQLLDRKPAARTDKRTRIDRSPRLQPAPGSLN